MGEKAKKKASPKKKSKKSAPSPKANTAKSNGKARNLRPPMVLERNDTTLPYNLLGTKIFAVEDIFAEEVRNNKGRTFEAGNVIQGKNHKYTVIGALGSQTYVVNSSDSNEPLIMKTEGALLPPDGPIIRRELLFLAYAKRRSHVIHRTHFMNFVDRAESASPSSSFAAVFMNKADFSLSDIRLTHLNGAEFSPQTAVRLCLETLQAIHDVHRNSYVHRDIQPKNFLVSGGRNGKSKIFITGFHYSYDLKLLDVKAGLRSVKQLAKLPMMNPNFQSRRYHRYLNTADPLVDLESWLFMCYSFFNSKSLPWAQFEKLSEREYLSQKEAFFSGTYDEKFEKLGLPAHLNAMRSYLSRIGPNDQIDYPFFAHILTLIASDLKVDWLAPYEWQKFLKTSKKTVVDGEESKDALVSVDLPSTPADDLVPSERKAPIDPVGRRRAAKSDRSVEQSQSADSSTSKDAVKKSAPVNVPEKTKKPVSKREATREEVPEKTKKPVSKREATLEDESEDIGSTSVDEPTPESRTPIDIDVVFGKLKQGNSQKINQDEKSTSK